MEKMSKLEEIEIFFEVFVPRASNLTLKSGVLPSPTSFPPQLPPNCVTFPPPQTFLQCPRERYWKDVHISLSFLYNQG